MPLRHLIILLVCVIAAAGLTVFVAQGILTSGEAITGSIIIALAMFVRVLAARK